MFNDSERKNVDRINDLEFRKEKIIFKIILDMIEY
jgi:hypothetical protein